MGKIYAVSDIHGYGCLLEALLERAKYDPGADRLYLLGDYVNKGPDSVGTLELVADLCRSGAVALQGNNERKWLHRLPDEIACLAPRTVNYQEMIANMPLWATCEQYLFVHAGIKPGVPLDAQTAEDLTEIRAPFFHSPPFEDKIIVFGHTSTFRLGVSPGQLWYGDGKLGIDTGAGHGYDLSLVDLTDGLQWSVSVLFPDRIVCQKIKPTAAS